MEIWKQIEEFPTYSISSFGNVKGSTGILLKQYIRNGYKTVGIYYKGIKKNLAIHQQVGIHFLEHSNLDKPWINHIDGNKLNNNVMNLEWCTPYENNKHARDTCLNVHHTQPIYQCDLEGNVLKEFSSIKEAESATGISNKHISSVCRGKRMTTGGYIWKYKNENPVCTNVPEGKVIDGFPNYIITPDEKVYSKRTSQYIKITSIPSGMTKVKLANNGVTKDFYISKLYSLYYGKSQSQVTMET